MIPVFNEGTKVQRVTGRVAEEGLEPEASVCPLLQSAWAKALFIHGKENLQATWRGIHPEMSLHIHPKAAQSLHRQGRHNLPRQSLGLLPSHLAHPLDISFVPPYSQVTLKYLDSSPS